MTTGGPRGTGDALRAATAVLAGRMWAGDVPDDAKHANARERRGTSTDR